MAYRILYDILNEIEESGEKDRILEVTNLLDKEKPHSWQSEMNVLDWVDEQLDLMNIPEGMFRQGYVDGLKEGGNAMGREIYNLIDVIFDMIPEESESESESEDEEEKEDDANSSS